MIKPLAKPIECRNCSSTEVVPKVNSWTKRSISHDGMTLIRCSRCNESFPVDTVNAMLQFPEFGVLKEQACPCCFEVLPEGKIVGKCPACGTHIPNQSLAKNQKLNRKFRFIFRYSLIFYLIGLGVLRWAWRDESKDRLWLAIIALSAAAVIDGIEGFIRGNARRLQEDVNVMEFGRRAIIGNALRVVVGGALLVMSALAYQKVIQ